MAEKLITIKEVDLNNNCPECYSTDLKITFKQKFKETNLYRSVTNETSQEIECNTCKTIIYPVMWTDDIERVYEYQLKAFTPKKTSTKLKKKAWLFIGLFVLLISAGIAFALLYK